MFFSRKALEALANKGDENHHFKLDGPTNASRKSRRGTIGTFELLFNRVLPHFPLLLMHEFCLLLLIQTNGAPLSLVLSLVSWQVASAMNLVLRLSLVVAWK